jgi:Tol biopolymer transport system component/tRNA A-37 threonylcarbamoyl transferase component Bud32
MYNPRTLPLSAGTKLGPYEVVSLIGSGGMGEVYKATDARLGRDVAIKVLPKSITNETERLKRFEQEARAVAALNHPNILTIYEIETHDGAPYLVSELLEGETLQQRLREGALPVRKALDIAVQSANGVAAAHEKGIVHRDLKPANIFITTDGRVKILDFGLAKLTQPEAPPGTPLDATQTRAMERGPVTEEGVVLGTAGYMSPEQVRGKAADGRSDIFALGTILYEMLSGHRAFQRDSSADTMAAILKEDPPELSGEGKQIPPAVDRVVRHALEKNPTERFQSARDFAFDLESLSGGSTSPSGAASAAAVAQARAEAQAEALAQAQSASMGRKLSLAIGAVALASIAAAAGWLIARQTLHSPPPQFSRLTFKRGYIATARFLPDAQSAIYTAAWEGAPIDIFEQRVESPESRSIGLPPDTMLLGISPSGELVVSLHSRVAGPFQYQGTLAEVPPSGSAPRELATFVTGADWSPDGKQIAAVRFPVASTEDLEYPLGKVLYETHGWMGDMRVAPDGQHIAFIDHDAWNDDGGAVAVVDMAGKKTQLTKVWSSARGLAWHGDEIYFTATNTGEARALYGVTLSGRQRAIATTPGSMNIEDVSKDGRVLYTQNDERIEMAAVETHSDAPPRALSWLDWSLLSDLSSDGKTLVFGESGEGAGQTYGIYIRNIDGSPAIRLGDGSFGRLSPDGKWVACPGNSGKDEMTLLPVGAGRQRRISGAVASGIYASWFPDSKTLLYAHREADNTLRIYTISIDGGTPRALTPAGQSFSPMSHAISPDGKTFIARRPDDGSVVLFPIEGGTPKELPMIKHNEYSAAWSTDGKSVFVASRGSVQNGSDFYKVNLETGKRDLVKTIMPADRSGFQAFDGQFISSDGSVIAFSYTRILSTLYILTPTN